MLIGYARISTPEQNLAVQEDALKAAGCEKIFTDTISGGKADRPGLKEVMSFARKGDTIVVVRLDRMGRSLKHLIDTFNDLQAQGIGIKSLAESLDTTTATGNLLFHIFGSLAEFERGLIVERTHAGLKAARQRGRFGGRPKKVRDPKALAMLRSEHAAGVVPVADLIRKYRVSRATFYRKLKEAKLDVSEVGRI